LQILASIVQFATKIAGKWVASDRTEADFRAKSIIKRFSYRFVIIVFLGHFCCEIAHKIKLWLVQFAQEK